MIGKSLKLLLPLILLAWRYTYFSRGRLSPWFAAGTLLILWGCSLFSEKWKLRLLPALIAGILLPFLTKAVYLMGQVLFFSLTGKGYGPIYFDSNWIFALPLYLTGLLLFLPALRYRSFLPWFLLLNTLLLAALEWLNRSIDPLQNLSQGLLFSGLLLLTALIILHPADPVQRRGRSFLQNSILSGILVLVVLFLFSRYEEGSLKQGGGLLQTDSFRFDFSDYLQLQSEVSLSGDLVFLFRKEGEAERMLLRRYLLTGYDEKGFHREDPLPGGEELPPYLPAERTELEDPGYQGRSSIRQEFFMVNFHPNGFLALDYPREIRPYKEWDDASFSSVYEVESMSYTESLWRLIRVQESDLDPEMLTHYTDYGGREDIRKLAEEITEEAARPFLKAREIEEYFHKNYYYSLKPGVAPGGDPLGYFLFDSRKGYCSYYAFAMTLMCRSLGIPARVALGFWVDPGGEVLNFYPVLANQAHAWVEVYFNEYGWVAFDPTSEQMAPGEEIIWEQMDRQEFIGLIEEILQNAEGLELKEALPEEVSLDEETPLGEWIGKRAKGALPILPLLYLLLLLLQRTPWLCFLRSRPEQRVRGILNWILRDLSRRGYDCKGLPRELERRLGAEIPVLQRTIPLYQQIRFADNLPEGKQKLSLMIRDFRRHRRTVSLKQRLRGLLYPLPQRRFL